MSVRVERWDGAGSPDAFHQVAARVYDGNPHAIMVSADTVLAGLQRAEFADRQSVWTAFEGGEPVARVVARISPTLRDRDRPVGMCGFFEALPRHDAVRALFDNAIAWLQAAGAGLILGPMDGDTWHKYRLNLGPYYVPPFLMEPFPAYPSW